MVVGVTGHQNLPKAALGEVTERLERSLSGTTPLEGVCSLAVGADQLFGEIVLKLGGELDVVVPSARYEETFVEPAHLAEYRRLLGRARAVEKLSYASPSESAFFAAGQRVVDRCQRLLAVWDGLPSRGLGGTADVVAYAVQLGKPVAVIWPAGLRR